MRKVTMGFEKKEDLDELRELFKHHIESFDHFIDAGLENAIRSIRPMHVSDPVSGKKLRIWLGKAEVKSPVRNEKGTSLQKPMFPQECRESDTTYRGKLTAEVCFQLDGGAVVRQSLSFGHLPIMLMSKLCHLRGADPKKLVSYKEEATGMGGYFICKGNERLCRSLILPKRNFPMATIRKSYSSKGDGFTDKAVSMRCVREDQSSVSVRLYYLQNGSARIGFWVRKKEFLLPIGIVLKALIDTTDREVYVSLTSSFNANKEKVKGTVGTQLVGERAQIILNELRDLSLSTRVECLRYIGQLFQPIMYGFEDESYLIVGEAVLREYVLVHLDSNHDKFNLLIFMLQKLFALVDQTAAPDNPDALQFQEVLLTGHLLAIYAKEKFEVWLGNSRKLILKELKNTKDFDIGDLFQVKTIMNKSFVGIGGFLESMIKTGKMATVSGLDLPQRDGMTIEAERLNFLRLLSHFRSVHRGAAFAKMRTTTVRKLLPESWGFLCPVHTPDGTPCGLLNHMTDACRVTSYYDSEGSIKDFLKIRMSILTVLFEMGMIPLLPKLEHLAPPEFLQVLLDGRVVGSISSDKVEKVVAYLRKMKSSPSSGILDDLEVGYVPLSLAGAYPGLYLFTSPSRLVRPVRNISQTCEGGSAIEYIGPFEQVYMEIRCADGGDGGRKNLFPATHEEIHPTAILSVVANLTPWSDHNQSPRNMYQCQMAKQTLAFGSQTLQYRSDNKLYHLQTPQSPIVRTTTYTKYCLDEFPTGTNAIVAVLAYTGYDMEDAMILNKSSVERGFCHGSIYQTESIDLENLHTGENVVEGFAKSVDRSRRSSLDSDGLPFVGQIINPKGIMYSTFNTSTSRTRFAEMKGSELSFIDYVAIDGSSSTGLVQKAKIRFRRTRNPMIGDKFSSRHGQKGVCSKLWPDIDMPFSSITGMRPDLIINPHAFPSRMTIAMLLESLGAKGGSLQGKFVDATPFSRCTRENVNPSCRSSTVDDLGPLLASYGFNYHGLEVMYSGVFGTELAFEVFIGPVYYQRLRHMVSDKYQVRSTGPIDQITRQPIGGRKRGGGIRFGEMERDALLAHGATYMLHDRLHTSSDYHIADVCSICGSLLTASTIQNRKRAVREISGLPPVKPSKTYTCHACNTSKGMKTVAMPYVFRYLAAELAAMNINMSLSLMKREKA